MEEKTKLKIFRFDPESGRNGEYDTFEGVPHEGQTVLNVLDYIYRERDTSLAFRGSLCTKGFCGGCGVMVNERPVMACQSLAEKEMIIAPHPGFKIIKDLVCDWNTPEEAPRPSQKRIRISADENCNHCRDCVKICVLKVFEVVDKRVEVAHPERCMGDTCRICMDTCQRRAIHINEIADSTE